MGLQWLHRVALASSSGCRQPRHCTFFLAKRMMPLLATEGVDMAMDRVCSPAGASAGELQTAAQVCGRGEP